MQITVILMMMSLLMMMRKADSRLTYEIQAAYSLADLQLMLQMTTIEQKMPMPKSTQSRWKPKRKPALKEDLTEQTMMRPMQLESQRLD